MTKKNIVIFYIIAGIFFVVTKSILRANGIHIESAIIDPLYWVIILSFIIYYFILKKRSKR